MTSPDELLLQKEPKRIKAVYAKRSIFCGIFVLSENEIISVQSCCKNVEGYKERQEILLDPDIIRTMNLKHEV